MTFAIEYILALFLVGIRLSAMLFMIPIFGGSFVPAQVRIMLGFALAMIIVPIIDTTFPESINVWLIGFYGLGELLVGLFLGLAVRTFFGIIEVAGHIISMEIGLMMAQQFDPESGGQTQMISVILFYVGAILFLIMGGHHMVVASLVKSYQIIGLTKETLEVGDVQGVINLITQIFSLAVSISAPFIAVNFLITLGFGVLGKVAPKINVLLVSFSFRILGGIIVFLITTNLIFNFLLQYSEEIPGNMLRLLF